MSDAIFKARMRAQRSLYRDGLSEIMLGIIFLQMIGGDLIIHSHYVPGIVVYFLLLFAFVIYARRIMDAVRARITYRRGGYVQAFTRGRILFGVVFLALFTGALVLVFNDAGRAGAAHPAAWLQWAAAFGGLGFGVVYIYLSMRFGLRRYLAVGIFSMILGVVVSIEYPWTLGLYLLIAGFGCANLCSGGIALLSYLRTPPFPANET
jgi:hypothetical protein